MKSGHHPSVGSIGTAALWLAWSIVLAPTRADEPAKIPQLPSLPQPSLPEPIGPADAAIPETLPQRKRVSAYPLLAKSMQHLAYGKSLELKLRQRVWVADREQISVGRYEQAGEGTGKVRMEMRIPTPYGLNVLVQVNDGHLAWSSQQVGDAIRVSRVDVLRLEDLCPEPGDGELPARMRVVGLIELLDALAHDYDLEPAQAKLDGQPIWIAQGPLGDAARKRLLGHDDPQQTLPDYLPDFARIAFSGEQQPVALLPRRIEYWRGDPAAVGVADSPPARRLSVLEIHDPRVVEIPDQHFEFGAERLRVDFENRTSAYAQRFSQSIVPAARVVRAP